MKIVFFGTPEFVIPVLQTLLKTPNCQLLAVVTQPDKPVGRQQILSPSPVKLFAQEHKIKVIDSGLMIYINKAVKKLAPDLGILAAYGKIIPQNLIDLFSKGILIIHPSLLPKYRGASPVQAAILAGEKETGVTIINMDEKMDHGPIIAQFSEPIKPDYTAESLYTRLFEAGAKVLVTILPAWVEGRIKPREQNHQKATYTWLLKKEDGKIDWKWKPEKIESFIRAMTPWPSAWTMVTMKQSNSETMKQLRLRILKAHLENGKLILDLVQLEGKKPVSWQQFQEGYPQAKLTFTI